MSTEHSLIELLTNKILESADSPVRWWDVVSQTPPTVFKPSKWNLLHNDSYVVHLIKLEPVLETNQYWAIGVEILAQWNNGDWQGLNSHLPDIHQLRYHLDPQKNPAQNRTLVLGSLDTTLFQEHKCNHYSKK